MFPLFTFRLYVLIRRIHGLFFVVVVVFLKCYFIFDSFDFSFLDFYFTVSMANKLDRIGFRKMNLDFNEMQINIRSDVV